MKKLIVAVAMICCMAECMARDVSRISGTDIVVGNAKKESGYSNAQLQALAKALNGRELTFENGKITSVSKSPIDGGVKAMFSFQAPGEGRYSRSLTVNATFSDAEMAKLVEKLDEGTKVKTLKGRVHYEGGFFIFFELKDATVEVDGPAPGESTLDPEKLTGAYIVAENARKKSGYSSAQLQALAKALNGRELTFENGKISSVSRSPIDGGVKAMMSFSPPGGEGRYSRSLTVNVTFSDAETAKFVEKLDEGTKVKTLKGRVNYDGGFFVFFELKDATVEVDGPAPGESTLDPEKLTGAYIVAENARKKSGYSSAQLQKIAKALNGRELTFENGKISSVSRSPIDGGVKAMMSFQAPGAGRFSRSLTVNATFSDAEMAKLVERLDEGAKVKTLKGRVHYEGGFFVFFELKDATVEVDGPAPGESAIDPEKVTGAYIVAENARKESGYSSAQLQALAKALNGRELTFENGKITSVSRNSIDGGVKAMMSFKAPGAGRFSRSLTVNATFSDAEMAKLVERLDEGTKVKTLKGRVHYEGGFFVFFELKDATVEVE